MLMRTAVTIDADTQGLSQNRRFWNLYREPYRELIMKCAILKASWR